jgi:hypothetical protein
VSGPGLIEAYLADLRRRLPPDIVAELSDGLAETYERETRRGLPASQAAASAIAEFGDPDTVAAAFVSVSPGRRAARRLLATGPLVGGCWAAALLARPGSNVGMLPRAVLGTLVLATIGVLASAAIGRRYARIRAGGFAGCIGVLIVDVTIVSYVASAGLITTVTTSPVAAGVAASLARVVWTIRSLRPALTRRQR